MSKTYFFLGYVLNLLDFQINFMNRQIIEKFGISDYQSQVGF